MGCEQSVDSSQNPIKPLVQAQLPFQKIDPPKSSEISIQNVLNFSQYVSKMKQRILTIPQTKNLVSHKTWIHIFDTFQKLYLNPDEKMELIDFFSQFLKVNFKQYQCNDEKQFCGQMGSKFQNLENRIYFKHRYCLQNLIFASKAKNQAQNDGTDHFSNLKMDMSDQEVQRFSSKVRNLCQNDLQSFTFITLYLIHAIDKFLEANGSLTQAQQLLVNVLSKLEQLYPATTNKTNVQSLEIRFKNLEKIKFDKKFDILRFKKGQKTNLQQLQDFIILKANKAAEDKQFFLDLIHKQCIKRGYGFKYGTKIKGPYDKSSIFRTIQKILDQDKYENAFQEQKNKVKDSPQIIQKDQKNKFKTFVENEKQEVKNLIGSLLQKETEIQFDAKDLLRAKCLYSKPQQLIDTMQELLDILAAKKIDLVDFKNRLHKKTKDVMMTICLPNTIAELQLALKFDTTSNEFNHKIYELLRSRIYTPLTNLYVQNEKWAQIFFGDQFDIFEKVVKNYGMQNFDEALKFKEIEGQVIEFKHRFLQSDVLKLTDEKEIQKQKITAQTISKPLSLLEQVFEKSFIQDQEIIDRSSNQILNQIYFFKKCNNFNKVQSLLQNLKNQSSFDPNSPTILELIADIDFQKEDYSNALKNYMKLIDIMKQPKESNDNATNLCSVLQNAGISCKYLGYYQSALEYLQRAQYLYQKANCIQNIQYANILYCLGMTYDDMQILQKSLQCYSKCLSIQQAVCGKESIEVSNTIHNMGLIYNKKGQYEQSLDCYEKCMKIQEYVLGKETIECAITLGNMGIALENLNQLDKALEKYQRSLDIKQKICGRQSIDCAIALNNIGLLYQSYGKYETALNYFLESTSIKQSIKGATDIDCAYSHLNLAIIYYDMHRYQEALQYAKKSYYIRYAVLGLQNPQTKYSLEIMELAKKYTV